MKQQKIVYLDFEVDKLTNSIENAVSGEVFDTIITRLNLNDYKQIDKKDWDFNWPAERKLKTRQLIEKYKKGLEQEVLLV